MNKLLVKVILEQAGIYDWQIQGLGMLRLYLSKAVRLHVWHSGFANPNVSTLHTHPWDFESHVIAGEVENIKYVESDAQDTINRHLSKEWNSCVLRCGPGGGVLKDQTRPVFLTRQPSDFIYEGQSYKEKAEEIHESKPKDGTVTIVERVFKPDEDHARVFWPLGEEWVSAEPRKATRTEVRTITQYALDQWFK